MRANWSLQSPGIWKSIAIFYGVAVGFAWACWFADILAPARFQRLDDAVGIPVMICLGTLGPLLGCFIAHKIESGNWRAVRVFPSSLPRAAWLVLGPLLVLAAMFVVFPVLISKGSPATWHWHPTVLTRILWPMLNYNLFGGPLFEEFGWRGFLQPHLERMMPPWAAAGCVGIAWALWHTPLFFMKWTSATPLTFGLILIGLSFVMAFAFRSSGYAVAVAVLMHAAFNASSEILPGFLGDTRTRARPSAELLIAAAFWLVGGAIVVVTRGRFGKPITEESKIAAG
jgi:membrane protease YdiL (CAAX protease family)